MRWNVLESLLRNKEHKIGAEIGVSRGVMTKNLLNLMPGIEKYYCIDPWEMTKEYQELLNFVKATVNYDDVYRDFNKNIANYTDKIEILKMESKDAAKLIDDSSLDFVFIDANHLYYSVKEDIELWYPKVKVGGLVSGHDFGDKFPGVKTAVEEIFAPYFSVSIDKTWWHFKNRI